MDKGINDFINGIFEFSGGLFLWLNVIRLYQHKSVKGVSLLAFSFFTLWGFILLPQFKSNMEFYWWTTCCSCQHSLDNFSLEIQKW